MASETDFNNCLETSEHHYKRHLIDSACSLSREGPMTLDEARSFFIKYSEETHPLYVITDVDGYYVYF